MATAVLTNEQMAEALSAHEKAGGDKTKAAKLLGIPTTTFKSRLNRALAERVSPSKLAPTSEIELPEFPDDDIPTDDLINHLTRRHERRRSSYEAHDWFPVKIRDNRPIGIAFVGDVHIDDNGCDWTALRRHIATLSSTEGMYAVNIGDTTNCWGGRLIKKYADQDTSVKTARKLARWLMLECGVRWLLWLYGNHEHMGDGAYILGEMAKKHGTHKIVMHDWEARFVLKFPNGVEFRVNCAHDFPGNSMYNPLHGPVKAAMFGSDLDLLVCGHKHNWAISQWELAEQGTAPLMIRARGYKADDDFARRIGKYDQKEGQSILVIFDPNAKTQATRLLAFVDIERGAQYLTWLRSQENVK